MPAGNGFNGGTVYHPTDTSLGTWGAVAIVPGYSALFADEEAWIGPWLASFGFVVIGVETNSRTDGAAARGTELLAALDYLTQRSPVRDRVDAARVGVIGHSAGGAGALLAAQQRLSLRSAVGLAPGSPSGLANLSADRVPTMFISGQQDTTVTRSYLQGLYATLPATTQNAWVEITGNDHLSFTRPNPTDMRGRVAVLRYPRRHRPRARRRAAGHRGRRRRRAAGPVRAHRHAVPGHGNRDRHRAARTL